MRAANGQLEQAVAEAVAIAEQNRRAAESISQLNQQMVGSLDSVSMVVEENTASTEEMASESSDVAEAIESIAFFTLAVFISAKAPSTVQATCLVK